MVVTDVLLNDKLSNKALTRLWVEKLVVGEGLCPFAHPVMEKLHIEECTSQDLAQVTRAFLSLLNEMQLADDEDLPTALFIVSQALADFDDYLDWLFLCEDLLEQSGLEGDIQLASFHPHYEFEGEDTEDMTNYSNRSPLPMIHFIRENHISEALKAVIKPEAIPERNKRHMRRLGKEGLLQLMPELADSAVFIKSK
ncbi:MAG: DUF1415 domain-containing protein [Oleispira sp.]|nr:DUF1415 domain-containing protein [Oleispira sp.]